MGNVRHRGKAKPTGRPRKTIDEKTILDMASKGRVMREIAAYCGVSEDTISRRFADVYERGRSLMRGSLRQRQFEVAMSGNPTMLKWLGMQELGQSERHQKLDLNQLFERMSRAEMEAYAREGILPAWFTDVVGATASDGRGPDDEI